MRLRGNVIPVAELSAEDQLRMFAILESYFDGVSFSQFSRDLSEKNWAVLLRDAATGVIRGFSTLMLMRQTVRGEPVWAAFSGDTIIEKEYWGEPTLARVWLHFIVSLRERYRPYKFYWFLISMGYKTYRFLPVYFNLFYPCHNRDIPVFEKQVLDAFARAKFGKHYDPDAGVIRFEAPSETLKNGVADIDERRIRNPHIRFFLERNPGYNRGTQLACLAEISVENLRKSASRSMEIPEPVPERSGR